MWAQFTNAMLEGDKKKAKKIYTGMRGLDREAAHRWLYGASKQQQIESDARQTAIGEVGDKEINKHCQAYKLF